MTDSDPKSSEYTSRNEIAAADARAAIQSVLLINGGAAAAILAFLGSASAHQKSQSA